HPRAYKNIATQASPLARPDVRRYARGPHAKPIGAPVHRLHSRNREATFARTKTTHASPVVPPLLEKRCAGMTSTPQGREPALTMLVWARLDARKASGSCTCVLTPSW